MKCTVIKSLSKEISISCQSDAVIRANSMEGDVFLCQHHFNEVVREVDLVFDYTSLISNKSVQELLSYGG